MLISSKLPLLLIILFAFSVIATCIWVLIGNAYIKFLPGVKRITLREFLIQIFIFYIFAIGVLFLIWLMIWLMFFNRHHHWKGL